MNAKTYNASLLLGLILVGGGVYLSFGVAAMLTLVGALLIVLTILGAFIATRG